MGLDALLERLSREAEAQAAEILAAATRRAQELEGRAEAETQRRRAEILERLETEQRHAVEAETATAARDYRAARMQARADLLDRVFREAEARLRATKCEAYAQRLPQLVAAAVGFLEGTPLVLRCRPEVASLLNGAIPPGTTLAASAEAAPGVLVEAGDGSVVVDNTLPALLQRRRPDLAVGVAARLEESVS